MQQNYYNALSPSDQDVIREYNTRIAQNKERLAQIKSTPALGASQRRSSLNTITPTRVLPTYMLNNEDDMQVLTPRIQMSSPMSVRNSIDTQITGLDALAGVIPTPRLTPTPGRVMNQEGPPSRLSIPNSSRNSRSPLQPSNMRPPSPGVASNDQLKTYEQLKNKPPPRDASTKYDHLTNKDSKLNTKSPYNRQTISSKMRCADKQKYTFKRVRRPASATNKSKTSRPRSVSRENRDVKVDNNKAFKMLMKYAERYADIRREVEQAGWGRYLNN